MAAPGQSGKENERAVLRRVVTGRRGIETGSQASHLGTKSERRETWPIAWQGRVRYRVHLTNSSEGSEGFLPGASVAFVKETHLNSLLPTFQMAYCLLALELLLSWLGFPSSQTAEDVVLRKERPQTPG